MYISNKKSILVNNEIQNEGFEKIVNSISKKSAIQELVLCIFHQILL